MNQIDDEKILTRINEGVTSMLSRIKIVKIDFTPRYSNGSDMALYEDEKGYYETINLDHGITKTDYLGKDIHDVINRIVEKNIVNYAIGVYEPERHKYLPSYKVNTTDWSLINDFIATCFKCVFPNEAPPVLPNKMK
jgi:hypothetical protein